MKYLLQALVLILGLACNPAWAQTDGGAIIFIGNPGEAGGTIIVGSGTTENGTLTLSGSNILSGLGLTSVGTLSLGTLGGTTTSSTLPTLAITGSFDLSTISSYLNTSELTASSLSYYTLNLDSTGTGSFLSGSLELNSPSLILQSSTPDAPVAPGTVFNLFTYQGTETGTFMYDGTPLADGSLFSWNGNTFQIDYAYGDPAVVITAVPEPSPVWMLLSGVILLFLTVRAGRPPAKK